MDRYELHVAGKKIISSTLKEVQIFAISVKEPYEIYVVRESGLFYVDPRKEGSGRKEKMSVEDKENALRLHEKGYTTRLICKKYHISMETLDKILHPEKIK